jgi:hypothetical protein
MRRSAALILFVATLAGVPAAAQVADVGIAGFSNTSPGLGDLGLYPYYGGGNPYIYEPGEQIALGIGYKNYGPDTAQGLGMTLTLPTGLPVLNQAGSCSGLGVTGTYSAATGAVTFANVPATLAANSIVHGTDLLFNGICAKFTAPALAFDVTAGISTTTAQGGNTHPDTWTQHFQPGPVLTLTDIGVFFVAGPAHVNPGDPVEFPIHVQNLGPRTATNVIPAVQLPGSPFNALFNPPADVTVAGGSYDPRTGRVTWTPATLPPGGEQVFRFSLRNPNGQQALALVTADNRESNYLNNVAGFLLVEPPLQVPTLSPALLALLIALCLGIGMRRRPGQRG